MKAFLAVLMNGTIFSESKTSSNCVNTLFSCTHYIFFLHTLYFFFLGYAFFTAKLQTDSKEMETEVVERKKPDSSLIDASCDFL